MGQFYWTSLEDVFSTQECREFAGFDRCMKNLEVWKMKYTVTLFTILLVSLCIAGPGDVIRYQSIPGQPFFMGLARDWDTGNIWMCGPDGSNNTKFAQLDPLTMNIVGSWTTISTVYWGFDIGYGYEMGGKKYLVVTDQQDPYAKLIDPTDGSWDGSLPNYYGETEYTMGCAVDWNTNEVHLASYYNSNSVFFDGSSYNIFSTTSDPRIKGIATGWGHVFLLRNSPYFDIEVYDVTTGAFVETISMSGFGGNSLIGLACGRENAVNENESIFVFGTMYENLFEVEIGDYSGSSSLERTTWAHIKAEVGM